MAYKTDVGHWVGNKLMCKCSECYGYVELSATRCPHCQAWLGSGEDPRYKKMRESSSRNNSSYSSDYSDGDGALGCVVILGILGLVLLPLLLFAAVSPGLILTGGIAYLVNIEPIINMVDFDPMITYLIISAILSIGIYVLLFIYTPHPKYFSIITAIIFASAVICCFTDKFDHTNMATPFLRSFIANHPFDLSNKDTKDDSTSEGKTLYKNNVEEDYIEDVENDDYTIETEDIPEEEIEDDIVEEIEEVEDNTNTESEEEQSSDDDELQYI